MNNVLAVQMFQRNENLRERGHVSHDRKKFIELKLYKPV